MIDGVNIEVTINFASEWFENSYLSFDYNDNSKSEKYEGAYYLAKYWGLHFIIWVEKKNNFKPYKLEIKGSLHCYFNEGLHNYNDFTIENLLFVVKDLEAKFKIKRNEVVLHGFEIGVNIITPIPVSELLKNLVVFKNTEFIPMRIGAKGRRKTVGKKIEQQRQTQKYYDKGSEYGLGVKNLGRFELSFDRMKGVQDAVMSLKKSNAISELYEILTLDDLTDLHKIKPLLHCIVRRWLDIIYHDKSICLKDLTPTQQKRYLYVATPRNWIDFTPRQRTRNKKFLYSKMKLHGSAIQQDISNLIKTKWKELTAEKCTCFNKGVNKNKQQENVHVLTVNIDGYNMDKTTINNAKINTQKKAQKSNQKKRVCVVCKKSISHKKANAKYCSKKCNNQYNGKLKTKKRQREIATEKKELEKLILLIDKNKMWLMVSYKSDDDIYTDTFHQKEITTTSVWVRSVQKVLVTEYRKNGKPIILTNYRARRLVKLINDRNVKSV